MCEKRSCGNSMYRRITNMNFHRILQQMLIPDKGKQGIKYVFLPRLGLMSIPKVLAIKRKVKDKAFIKKGQENIHCVKIEQVV